MSNNDNNNNNDNVVDAPIIAEVLPQIVEENATPEIKVGTVEEAVSGLFSTADEGENLAARLRSLDPRIEAYLAKLGEWSEPLAQLGEKFAAQCEGGAVNLTLTGAAGSITLPDGPKKSSQIKALILTGKIIGAGVHDTWADIYSEVFKLTNSQNVSSDGTNVGVRWENPETGAVSTDPTLFTAMKLGYSPNKGGKTGMKKIIEWDAKGFVLSDGNEMIDAVRQAHKDALKAHNAKKREDAETAKPKPLIKKINSAAEALTFVSEMLGGTTKPGWTLPTSIDDIDAFTKAIDSLAAAAAGLSVKASVHDYKSAEVTSASAEVTEEAAAEAAAEAAEEIIF